MMKSNINSVEGEVVLILEDGTEKHLKNPGDTGTSPFSQDLADFLRSYNERWTTCMEKPVER